MSRRNDHVLVGEQDIGQGPGELGLADTGRPEEEEAPDRPVGVAEPGAGTADGLGHGLDGLGLSDDALMQALLEGEQLRAPPW